MKFDKSLVEELSDSGSDIDARIQLIIEDIEALISQDKDMNFLSRQISKMYQDKEITKEELNERLDNLMCRYRGEEWVAWVIGQLKSTNIAEINDNALRGRIKMLFAMGMRHHNNLTPSEFAKSQLKGVMYEHAFLGALKNYFESQEGFENILEIRSVGAEGKRTDIEFILHPEKFNQQTKGESTFTTLGMSIKNTDYTKFLETKDSHNNKLRVGGGKKIFQTEDLKQIYSIPRSVYFLSRSGNPQKALGENIVAHGFSEGRFVFTYDLVESHLAKNIYLSMPQVTAKNYYIEWMHFTAI